MVSKSYSNSVKAWSLLHFALAIHVRFETASVTGIPDTPTTACYRSWLYHPKFLPLSLSMVQKCLLPRLIKPSPKVLDGGEGRENCSLCLPLVSAHPGDHCDCKTDLHGKGQSGACIIEVGCLAKWGGDPIHTTLL